MQCILIMYSPDPSQLLLTSLPIWIYTLDPNVYFCAIGNIAMGYLDPWATQPQRRKHGRHPERRAAQSPRMRLEGSLDPKGIFRSQVKAVRKNS